MHAPVTSGFRAKFKPSAKINDRIDAKVCPTQIHTFPVAAMESQFKLYFKNTVMVRIYYLFCVFVCIYIHTYIHTYILISIHTYACTDFMPVKKQKHMPAHTHTICVCVCIHTHTHTFAYIFMYVDI